MRSKPPQRISSSCASCTSSHASSSKCASASTGSSARAIFAARAASTAAGVPLPGNGASDSLSSALALLATVSGDGRFEPHLYRRHIALGGRSPTSVSVSATSLVLMRLSSGDPEDKEGQMLTSSSQGFRSVSTNTSKPYISKQLLRWAPEAPTAHQPSSSEASSAFVHSAWIGVSTAIRVLIARSLMRSNISLKSMPCLSMYCRSSQKDHLKCLGSSSFSLESATAAAPSVPSAPSRFCTKAGDALLTE
mmetsp:Transcript_68727/g.135982  ORF Transcript_68727/g.135982 Transcript_68727/m.135982 type:complete len:250 (-) Transcript_68727:158-907(-)